MLFRRRVGDSAKQTCALVLSYCYASPAHSRSDHIRGASFQNDSLDFFRDLCVLSFGAQRSLGLCLLGSAALSHVDNLLPATPADRAWRCKRQSTCPYRARAAFSSRRSETIPATFLRGFLPRVPGSRHGFDPCPHTLNACTKQVSVGSHTKRQC